MKFKIKKQMFFSALFIGISSLGLSVSCSNKITFESKQSKFQYKTKEITLRKNDNSIEPFFVEFINEINFVKQLPKEYNKVLIRVPWLNIQKKFSREDFETSVIPSISKVDLKFNLENNDLEFNIGKDMTLKEIEDFLEEKFNNYYVSDKFFLEDLKVAIDKADYSTIKWGDINKEKAKEKGKLNEYQNIVSIIKEWIYKNSKISFSNEIDIVEINYNKILDWSLNLKLSLNG
ncbi:hypothetical protein [Mycoplasma sp. CSL7503-lung]|uniref:hypothetical protein n=1 Tax=Mycoplasma sp. CSL7503-lung TaxID=536372 RepID=UPI0021D321FF|nr:hypothetical protein [Mycoplasma sp. CSL7503-lung]MCU4706356.1 hypothetical protein [Mycoplasma sp. CSL7503-lung]